MADTDPFFVVTVLWNSGTDLFKLDRLRYRQDDEDTAWKVYDAMCAVGVVSYAVLAGPDGEVLASWDRTPLVEGVE